MDSTVRLGDEPLDHKHVTDVLTEAIGCAQEMQTVHAVAVIALKRLMRVIALGETIDAPAAVRHITTIEEQGNAAAGEILARLASLDILIAQAAPHEEAMPSPEELRASTLADAARISAEHDRKDGAGERAA